jgi:hypothetical protein
MKFARIVFIAAGVWGIAVLAPLFFLVDISGRPYAPPTVHPHFFYGFLTVTMAWQIAFIVIGSNPARYRLMIIPGIIEKLGFIVTVTALYSRAAISAKDASAAVPDAVLAVLFIIAFLKTRDAER